MKSNDTCYYPEHGNALDLLRLEYANIWKLCQIYKMGLDGNSRIDRAKVAHELCHMISICNVIEQEILYPEVRKVDEKFVFDLLLAHDDINASILEIRTLTPDDMDYDLEVLRLIDFMQEHIRKSERGLFPLIKREIPTRSLRPLTADFVRRRLLLGLLSKSSPASSGRGSDHIMPRDNRGTADPSEQRAAI